MHVSIKMVEDIIRQDKLSRLYINERHSEDLADASDGSSRFYARRKTTDIWLVSTDYDSPVQKEAGKRQSLYMFWLKLILIWGRINGDSCIRVIWDTDHTKTISPTTNKVIINANKLKRTQDEHLSFNITIPNKTKSTSLRRIKFYWIEASVYQGNCERPRSQPDNNTTIAMAQGQFQILATSFC